ncbi:disease resistance protein At4g27190-like [Camellia sinensis]|uniref:disease resistance protein At4g27190-like n=1 Tax=Camellia sinensis TaxID=4442 RepID=UPI001035FEE6|nr:disease resistance protein At4g27190-like [Camellia sinensis]
MNVMKTLSDDNINFIGIYGIGGVAKTTLVKEFGKQAKSDKLFDEVVMDVVSQNPDIKKIQDKIGGILAIGIPSYRDHKGCKIIITTQREQVCNSMEMERLRTKILHLSVLSEKDSWDLFKKNVGDVVDSNKLNILANEVCKECGGLPIALVTVGSAMKGKDDPNLWNDAARELRKSMPPNIEGVDQQVCKSLRLSYDYLQDEKAKACFLLYSLFPEDHNILIEDLVRYGMGLRVFKKVDTMLEANGRAKSVTDNLIAPCLLLASDNKQDCIKMHDVVCDVAIDIGSKQYLVRAGCNLKDWPNMDSLDLYTGISLMRN